MESDPLERESLNHTERSGKFGRILVLVGPYFGWKKAFLELSLYDTGLLWQVDKVKNRTGELELKETSAANDQYLSCLSHSLSLSSSAIALMALANHALLR